MTEKIEKLEKAYFEKAKRDRSPSGIPLKEFYAPGDIKDLDYKGHVGDPGEYPYTRGIHKTMFRGRLWSRRELSGFASPEESNKRLKYLAKTGESALSIIFDGPSMMGIEPDSPQGIADVGRAGVPINSMRDAEVLTKGIPLEKVSFTLFDIVTNMGKVLGGFI